MQPLPTALPLSASPQTIPVSGPMPLLPSLSADANLENTGITQPPVIPVLPNDGTPVLPGVLNEGLPAQEPVNPVNHGNLASVPTSEPEGNTDGVTPKTFKIPNPVFRSLEESVRQLNEVTPGYTVHSYGVEILSRHLEFRQAAANEATLRTAYQNLEKHYSANHTLLQRESQRVLDLTTQLRAATDYVNRQEHHPTPSQVLPPVLPQPDAVIPEFEQKYNALVSRYEKSLDGYKATESELAEVKAFIQLLPEIVNLFAKEAASNSWYTQAYYVAYFRTLVSTYSK